MITIPDIDRQYYPEIGDKDSEDAPDWHLLVDPIKCMGFIIFKALKPYLITALYLYLLWPREISLDIFL